MTILERLSQTLERVQAYPWWQIAIELLVIGILTWGIVRFIQSTRAAAALKGLLLLLIIGALLVRIVGQRDAFQRLTFLYDNFLTISALALIVIFQPELRRGLIRLGETAVFRRTPQPVVVVVEAIAEAAAYLSKAKFGGLIVIERETPLKALAEGGTVLHAAVSSRLIQTLFFPGTALHDLAVIIRGGEILAAGVQLPLAEPSAMPDASLGSRHRAAVGLTQECDALVVVISEETGAISLAEHGKLTRGLDREELEETLVKKLRAAAAKPGGRVRATFARPGASTADPSGESVMGASVAGMSLAEATGSAEAAPEPRPAHDRPLI
ncbi:MAG: diadenylate cyclase CdaA [Phycisphaerales bacterium]